MIRDKLREITGRKGLTLLRGMRGCGKTTAAAALCEPRSFVSCRSLKVRHQILFDAAGFLTLYGNPVVVDDVDEADGLLEGLARACAETGRSVLACGNPPESEVRAARLAGGEDFREIEMIASPGLGSSPTAPVRSGELTREAIRGSLPALAAGGTPTNSFWSEWTSELLSRDIGRRIRAGEEGNFYSMLRSLAKRAGTELNMSAVAAESRVSSVTVKKWIGMLDDMHVIRLVPALPTASRRPVKRPKLFFTDTAAACYLTDMFSADMLAKSGLWRGFALNAIAARLRRERESEAGSEFFYRDSNLVSTDWIQMAEGKARMVSCAFSREELLRKSRDLCTVSKVFGCPAERMLFDFSGTGPEARHEGVSIIPCP